MTTEDKTLTIEDISEKLMEISEEVGNQGDEVGAISGVAVSDVEYTCGDIEGELDGIRSQLVDLSIDLGQIVVSPKGIEDLGKKIGELSEKLSKNKAP